MITWEKLEEVNKNLKSIPVKGKNYVMVNARVTAFRRLCPEGRITTEILSNEGGTVLMKATVADENGKVLSTGFAYEKESASYINKTSYIENCETSAVGRALGMLGIGDDDSIASAEELVNAINNQSGGRKQAPQDEPGLITVQQAAELQQRISKIPYNGKYPSLAAAIAAKYGVTDIVYLKQKDFPKVVKDIEATEYLIEKQKNEH